MAGTIGCAALFGAVVAMGTAAMAAPPTDACALLTPTQVSAAVGQTVGSGKYMGPGFTRTCTWDSEGMIVTLLVQQDTKMFDATKSSGNPGIVRTAASGVGDDAFYLGVGTGAALWVKKGAGAFKMTVYTKKLSLDQTKSAEMTLAQQVAGKF
jgi:hypothetical protein